MNLSSNRILKLIPELLVIFIGVYCAFLLDNYRTRQQELKYQKDYFNSFLSEIQSLQQTTHLLTVRVDTIISQLDKNEKFIQIYQRGLDLTHNQFLIQSAFINTNFSTIGPDFLVNLEHGSNLMRLIDDRFKILDEESRKFAIYRGNDISFKAWYRDELVYISGKLHRLIEVIEKGALPDTQAIIDKIMI